MMVQRFYFARHHFFVQLDCESQIESVKLRLRQERDMR